MWTLYEIFLSAIYERKQHTKTSVRQVTPNLIRLILQFLLYVFLNINCLINKLIIFKLGKRKQTAHYLNEWNLVFTKWFTIKIIQWLVYKIIFLIFVKTNYIEKYFKYNFRTSTYYESVKRSAFLQIFYQIILSFFCRKRNSKSERNKFRYFRKY